MESKEQENQTENVEQVDQLALLEQKILDIEKKAKDNWELALRTKADAENATRRAAIDVESAHKFAVEKFAIEMLSIHDSLDMGIVEAKKLEEQSIKPMLDGMILTRDLMLSALEKFKVKAIDALNKPFDPKLHEAISTMPNENVDENTVMQVVVPGFTIHDRVLRTAKVIVSKSVENSK